MIEQFAEGVQARAKQGYGIDIISIMAIVEMILELIDGCFEDENEFVQSAQSPNRLQRAALNVMIRRHLGVRGRRNVLAVAQSVMDECEVCSAQQFAEGFREAKGLFHPDVIDYDFDPTVDVEEAGAEG